MVVLTDPMGTGIFYSRDGMDYIQCRRTHGGTNADFTDLEIYCRNPAAHGGVSTLVRQPVNELLEFNGMFYTPVETPPAISYEPFTETVTA
jgi:hypothetical protein